MAVWSRFLGLKLLYIIKVLHFSQKDIEVWFITLV